MDLTGLIVIIVALILIGLLTGIEIAFISANKMPMEVMRKTRKNQALFWSNILDNSTKFIASILLGVSTFLVLYALLIGKALEPLWLQMVRWFPKLDADDLGYIRLLVEALIATVIILLVEVASKSFFAKRKNVILQNSFITGFSRFFTESSPRWQIFLCG